MTQNEILDANEAINALIKKHYGPGAQHVFVVMHGGQTTVNVSGGPDKAFRTMLECLVNLCSFLWQAHAAAEAPELKPSSQETLQ